MNSLFHRLDDPTQHPEKVCIPTGPDKWLEFARGYKEAADHLASTINQTGTNVVSAPMMFLYRHYLELHLKSLLKDAGEALDEQQPIPPRHYLLNLWGRVRTLLLRMRPNAESELVRADDLIRQLDSWDATSFAFRYPVDKSGAASLRVPVSIHPLVVKYCIEELYDLLDGASLTAEAIEFLKSEGLWVKPE